MSTVRRQTIAIESHAPGFKLVDELRDLIADEFTDIFEAVIAHGSVATNEVIAYSDFDGLLIVKDDFWDSRKLKLFKSKSMHIILRYDPLQHHGWFLIKRSQLENYPETYLPVAVLKRSTLIYPGNRVTLEISTVQNSDFSKGLLLMIDGIEKKIKRGWNPQNVYQLKSYLSEIMLLPALYCSTKTGVAVHKGDSFSICKQWFSDSEWKAISQASQIRSNWMYQLNPIQRLLMTRPERIFRKLTQKYLAPKIPENLQLPDDFKSNLLRLIHKMKETA